MRAARIRVLTALGLLASLVACGDEVATPEEPASATAEKAEAPETAAAEGNARPRILEVRFEPEEPGVDGDVRAVVETEDADGDSLWLDYSWTLAGEELEFDGERLELRGASKGDVLEVSVTASDGKRESEPEEAWTEVRNSPPKILRLEVEGGDATTSGTEIVVRPEARDVDGDEVSFEYTWTVNGRSVREDGPVFSTRDLRRGDVARARVVASDGDDDSEAFETPDMKMVNSAPRIVSKPGSLSDDGVFRYDVVAEDPDGDTVLQFRLEDAPAGMTIHPLRGAIRWIPGPQHMGTHSVSVIADDLQGGRVMQTFEITVSSEVASEPAGGSQPPAQRGE